MAVVEEEYKQQQTSPIGNSCFLISNVFNVFIENYIDVLKFLHRI